MPRLIDPGYMAFPFRIGKNGAATSQRVAHVREQIEQVLFTNPGERVFHPEFGVGVRALVFEPNGSALWEITRKRLLASLADALQGEVDPKTLEVDVQGEEEKLYVVISYTLAAIGHTESHQVPLT
jgi:hypothetical protein